MFRSAEVARLEGLLTVAQRALERGEARYDALLEKYHALRVMGGATPEPRAVLAPAPDPVAEAIHVAANGNGALARQLGRFAIQQRLEGAEESAILRRLMHWGVADEEEGIPA